MRFVALYFIFEGMSWIKKVATVFVWLLIALSAGCGKEQKHAPKTYSKAVAQKKNALDKALLGTWDNEGYFDLVKARKEYIEPDAEVSHFGILTFSDDFISSDSCPVLASSYEAGSCMFYGEYDSVKNTYSFVSEFDSKIGFTIEGFNGKNEFICATTTGKRYRYTKEKNGGGVEQRVAKYNKALIAGKYYNKNNPEEIIEFGLPNRLLKGFEGYSHYNLNVWSADYNGVLTISNQKNTKYYKYKLTQETLALILLNDDLVEVGNEVVYVLAN